MIRCGLVMEWPPSPFHCLNRARSRLVSVAEGAAGQFDSSSGRNEGLRVHANRSQPDAALAPRTRGALPGRGGRLLVSSRTNAHPCITQRQGSTTRAWGRPGRRGAHGGRGARAWGTTSRVARGVHDARGAPDREWDTQAAGHARMGIRFRRGNEDAAVAGMRMLRSAATGAATGAATSAATAIWIRPIMQT